MTFVLQSIKEQVACIIWYKFITKSIVKRNSSYVHLLTQADIGVAFLANNMCNQQ